MFIAHHRIGKLQLQTIGIQEKIHDKSLLIVSILFPLLRNIIK